MYSDLAESPAFMATKGLTVFEGRMSLWLE